MFASDPFLVAASIDWSRVPDRERYPYSIPAIAKLTSPLALHPRVTFFVGENGSGKSTLLEAIAVSLGINPEGGSRDFNFATRASHSSLHEALKLDRGRNLRKPKDAFLLRAESFYNVATEMEALVNKDGKPLVWGDTPMHAQSHGESFIALAEHRFRRDSIVLLDEPESALSPGRQHRFLAILHRLVHTLRAQVIIATHSPILLAYPHAQILAFDDDGVHPIAYEATEHYRIAHEVLTARAQVLERVLGAPATADGEELLSSEGASSLCATDALTRR